ncbi:glutamate--tRNA ligase [Malacoplasma iowae]|uniref:Glutamate--tRNA ligase n=1 Tax=Malacoplasma iowae DK-CPA TaxID=1394179 RepID=A0A084U3I4_MALIO|nr:glutamate--tRNA ligase [Malacoplasma iowae]KFB07520.1 glutamyl-tRNA synthetase [Malacoplasma iowae DK-CPA]WPL37231.1 glutamate--tRNA ligase [Malacoplasma iowae]WPL37651.1 glutamate--tRNA ligase [Malacoplasma iowae]WPL40783.1 glutamate--tRNA ligase [Malacoplasma iowae]
MNNNSPNKIVRTRYAPSPTGLFHIGGARTALFNYLFAKKNNGDFIVRIEDTDIDRNVEGGAESQLNNLKWLRIFPDESLLNPGNYGPYIQTEKLKRYQELANKLLKEKKAYRCFCTPEKLEEDRKKALDKKQTPKYNKTCLKLTEEEIQTNLKNNVPYSIRLNIDANDLFVWNDIVRGEISVPASALTDPVILKSNNIPMYNFAVVVDDYDMKISHVIRGEEHISNTPYQLAIKRALGFESEIQYGHLSVIVDDTGKKLSKRNIELKQFIEDYKNMGFLPESIVNFMYLLGMAAPDGKEIFDMQTSIKNFDINKVSKSSTMFDFKKMEWISSEHFKLLSDSAFVAFVSPFIEIEWKEIEKHKTEVILLFKNQITYAKQLNDLIYENFLQEKDINPIIKSPIFKEEGIKEFIEIYKNKIKESIEWSVDSINEIIKQIKEETNRSGKNLFMPIRLLSTHSEHGPELAKVLFILGKDKVLLNVNKIYNNLNKKK